MGRARPPTWGLLVPFQYFGVHDGTDLSWIDWRRGRYDVETLERVYTADERRASRVLQAVEERVRDPREMRALGFCVSVRHAELMARYFDGRGVPAAAVVGETAAREREASLHRLRSGELKVLFTVDLFNEGVDVPSIDTVLFLRPTESATIFLQQLGRGLRLADDKECLTVLDFIGTANRRFRFDRRYRALIGGTRAHVRRAVEEGFPQLPAGCEIRLDRESQQAVLENVRTALPSTMDALGEDLRAVGDVGLRRFLRHTELDLEDLYRPGRTYTALLHRAGLRAGAPSESGFTRAVSRLLHVDDEARLGRWRAWLREDEPLGGEPANPGDPLQLMLFAALGQVRRPVTELGEALRELWEMDDLRRELAELLEELDDRRRRPTFALADLPFAVHATYSRDEISAGLGQVRKGKLMRTQAGVLKHDASRSDVLYVTLQKDEKDFTPTTLYDDYAISPARFHWESQSATRADSPTGRRYREHAARGWRILLFVRQARRDERGETMPYLFLGPVRYVSHEGEKPMAIVWELERPMPAELFQRVEVRLGEWRPSHRDL